MTQFTGDKIVVFLAECFKCGCLVVVLFFIQTLEMTSGKKRSIKTF
jgi:hypothetical protein